MATHLTKFLPSRAAPHPTAKVPNSTVRPFLWRAAGQPVSACIATRRSLRSASSPAVPPTDQVAVRSLPRTGTACRLRSGPPSSPGCGAAESRDADWEHQESNLRGGRGVEGDWRVSPECVISTNPGPGLPRGNNTPRELFVAGILDWEGAPNRNAQLGIGFRRLYTDMVQRWCLRRQPASSLSDLHPLADFQQTPGACALVRLGVVVTLLDQAQPPFLLAGSPRCRLRAERVSLQD